ncbi:hypothetical protein [Arthrobacter sp. SD76]|uniref:hypothetical protein n=1 Tax=Arthrobacter sp. SD76 TaxID=3415007 RepID=UPI003C79268D
MTNTTARHAPPHTHTHDMPAEKGPGRPALNNSPATSDDVPARRGSRSAARKAKRKAREREQAEAQNSASTRWHHGRKWRFASRLGFYDPAAPGVLTSTRQMEFSHMAIASPPTSHRGLVFGVDAGSGWMIVHDPFTAYGDTIESPNVCYIGDLGQASPPP